jgi:hypothetical protein
MRTAFHVAPVLVLPAESDAQSGQLSSIIVPVSFYRIKNVNEPHERSAKEHELRSAA